MLHNLYPAILRLQDGTSYKGWSLFELSIYRGEIVFNTGMTGYQEVLSDPSYSGQMVVFTYPEIGNTGLNKQDNESNFITVKSFIVRNISFTSSNWRSKISLRQYLINKRIPHIFGLDTRALTKHLRSSGVMDSFLCSSHLFNNHVISSSTHINSLDLIRKVTTRRSYLISSTKVYSVVNKVSFSCDSNILTSNHSTKRYNVVVIDLGIKFNIIRKLLLLGCNVFIVPATSNYLSIFEYNPDGILLSNGPGDPLIAWYAVNIVRKLIKFSNIPIFGICMGHQVLNKALGAETFKLKFGHRGLNHPTGFGKYSEITSQNHGFVVKYNSNSTNYLSNQRSLNFFNLNDLTIACTFNLFIPIFSVQYHPEASPGPNDAEYLFKVFIDLMGLMKVKKTS